MNQHVSNGNSIPELPIQLAELEDGTPLFSPSPSPKIGLAAP